MEQISFTLSIANIVATIIAGLIFKNFLPSYLARKGENTASKEDLSRLTDLVEHIKALHTSEIERLKASLIAEGQVTERRRRIYEEMCAALRVFVAGHGNSQEAKERFHSAHAAAWLWASDSVLQALNHFIDLQVRHAAAPGSIDQQKMKAAYAAVVLAMRKDVGFSETSANTSDYQFVQF